MINRLKRTQGQLDAVIPTLKKGKDCKDIVTQLSAVSKARDRAGFSIIAGGHEQCIVREDTTWIKRACSPSPDLQGTTTPYRGSGPELPSARSPAS